MWGSQFSTINKNWKGFFVGKDFCFEMCARDVLGREFVARLDAYNEARRDGRTRALQGILEAAEGAGTVRSAEPLALWCVVAGAATTEQWPGTWSTVDERAICKMLGSSQVSQEGCLAIEVATRYIKIFPDTSKTIRVHAMLLWNGLLERERGRAGGETETETAPGALAFVLLPLACLLMACKLSGRGRVAPTLEYLVCISMCVCQTLYGTHEGMDAERVKEVRDALRDAENRVLGTMDWEIDLMAEIEEALKLVELRRVEIQKGRLDSALKLLEVGLETS